MKKSKKYKPVKIESLEGYLKEIGVVVTTNYHPGEYKEIYDEDKSYKKDDILSITPGLYSPPSSRLYASLLSAMYAQELKQTRQEQKDKRKISKELIDLYLKEISEKIKKGKPDEEK